MVEGQGPSVEEVLAALEPYEFATFQLGSTAAHDKARYARAIAERFHAASALKHPDVTVVLGRGTLDIVSRGAFFYGRYLKPDRSIPQTKWPCRECKGRGCPRCHGTGKMYQETVEEVLAAPLLASTGGTATRLHGCGREDIDARMLGSGRPFVLEVVNPRRRSVAMPCVSHPKAQFLFLRPCAEGLGRELKSCAAFKRYRALVRLDGEVGEDRLRTVHDLCGSAPVQRTPTRVLHRRPDLERERLVASLSCRRRGPRELVLDLVVASGFYVKEFVSGDGGRTAPSLAGRLGVGCRVERLDVLAVFDPTLLGLVRELCPPAPDADPIEGARRLGMVLDCGCPPEEQLSRVLAPAEREGAMEALRRAHAAEGPLAIPAGDDAF